MTNKLETIKMEKIRCELHLKELVNNLKEYQIIINTRDFRDTVDMIKTYQWIIDNYDAVIKEINSI